MLWCSPEPQLSPLALALLFPSPVRDSPFRPLSHGLLHLCQALQLPFPLCLLSVPHGICTGSLLPNMASPLSALPLGMPTPHNTSYSQQAMFTTPKAFCVSAYAEILTWGLFFSPPPTSSPSTLFPSLSSYPAKELCGQAA